MRTCQSCGRQNPDDRDFCECGEYLRWEATGVVQAVPAELSAPAPAEPVAEPQAEPDVPAEPAAPPAEAQVVRAAPVPPPAGPGNGHGAPHPPTAVQPTPEPAGATITLRLPDRDPEHGTTLAVGVEPGQRASVLALVRNQSGIVDNYELRVEGLPREWWSIFPDTVYLVPFGSSGTYEQEVEIQLHPPRSPEAEARIWELRVVALSKAQSRDAVSQPLALGIQPYTETATKVRPERAKGRRKADFTVAVENRANAPVVVALEGTDPDGELQFGFDRPPADIRPGDAVQTTMRVRPPKQLWLGRPVERRFEVTTHTGDAAAERLAAEPEAGASGPSPAAKRGRWRVPGVSPPQVFKPQLHEPGVSVGPGGIDFRKPQLRAPQLRGPDLQAKSFKLSDLKPGGAAAAAAPAGPLLPSQAIFRQKPWLPWWLVPVGLALAALALMLYLLLPRDVVVPDVVGAPSAFAAEEALTEAGLKLAPEQKPEVREDAEPGEVIRQTPPAGEEAEEGSEVAVLIAIGTGEVTVPSVVGLTPAEADQALREARLSLGQASPQPIDPAGKIESQIPEEEQVVAEGTPVDVFFPAPGDGEEQGEEEGGEGGAGGGGGGAGGSGGGGGAEVVVPAVAGAALEAFAQAASEQGLVPEQERVFDASEPGTLVGTDPPAGTPLAEGATVKLLISAGAPDLVFDDNRDVLRANGLSGRALDPVADGPQLEKDPAFAPDGERVAYVGGGRVFLADLGDPDAPAVALTPDAQEYADLAWSPSRDVDVLALARSEGDDTDLCVGRIRGDAMRPRCIAEADFRVGGAIHWAPNGRAILAGGAVNDEPGVFGVVRWRSREPFSADPDDWGRGRFVTDTSTPNAGVREAALSPDGTRLALIAKTARGPFRLVLAEPGDFPMSNAQPTSVRACKLAWRGDSRELAVVQADANCLEEVGTLVRLPVRNPRNFDQLDASGDNPVFQPLTPGG